MLAIGVGSLLVQAADSARATSGRGPLGSSNDLLVALSTVAMALFTFFLWRIQANEHSMRHFARLHVCASRAVFESTRNLIHVEVLLLNASDAPAIIEDWEALVRDGKFQESVADGSLGPTKYMKVPAYLSGKGWVLERRLPTALSLRKALRRGSRAERRLRSRYTMQGAGSQRWC